MSQLTTILAGLEELRSKGNSNLWSDPANTWCVTFQMKDATTRGEPYWMQITADQLNMQYLDDDEPALRLAEEVTEFPAEFRQIAWDRALHATFQMPSACSALLPTLIDRITRQYFALSHDYEVSYKVEYMGDE